MSNPVLELARGRQERSGSPLRWPDSHISLPSRHAVLIAICLRHLLPPLLSYSLLSKQDLDPKGFALGGAGDRLYDVTSSVKQVLGLRGFM